MKEDFLQELYNDEQYIADMEQERLEHEDYMLHQAMSQDHNCCGGKRSGAGDGSKA